MIGSLRGKVIEIHATSFLCEVGGLGYVVRATPPVLTTLVKDAEVFVYIHDHLREDAHDLYGFLALGDLDLFEQLLGVSGVGPKVAMTLLSIGSAETVRRSIMAGDVDALTSVPGIGKKTAQKIVLELKGQLVEPGTSDVGDREVVEALESLGYSASQARDALKAVPTTIVDISARVREALRLLAR